MILEIIKENDKFAVVMNFIAGRLSLVDAEVEKAGNGIHLGCRCLVWVLQRAEQS